MSNLNWKDLFDNDIHPMHIEHNIACNSAAKPGATDKSMNELIERCGTDERNATIKTPNRKLDSIPFFIKKKKNVNRP
jgi:hypothetical protein